MDKHLVVSALQKAYFNPNYPKGVVLYSDRGSQYILTAYLEKARTLD